MGTVWRDPYSRCADERYEVNHCSETEKMPNQVERRLRRMEWSRVSKPRDLLHRDGLRKMVM